MFHPAARPTAPVRMLLTGPPGSGKTLTALRIAAGLATRIAVLDTYGSHADWYVGYEGDGAPLAFDGCTLPADTGAAELVKAIRHAAEAGYEALVIDGISPIHGQIRGRVDSAPKPSDGWARYHLEQRAILDAIHAAPLHVMITAETTLAMTAATAPNGRPISLPVGVQPRIDEKMPNDLDYWLTMSEGCARIVKSAPHPGLPGSDHDRISAEWARQHLAPRHALQARQRPATPQVAPDPTQDTPDASEGVESPPAPAGALSYPQTALPSAVAEVRGAAGAAARARPELTGQIRGQLEMCCGFDATGKLSTVPADRATRDELIQVLRGIAS